MGFRISFRGVPYFLYVRDPTRVRECERDSERGTQSECECESERVRERDRERGTQSECEKRERERETERGRGMSNIFGSGR